MMTQRLTVDENATEATLFIRGNNLAEVQGLAEELKLRANVTTEGTITLVKKIEDIAPPPPADE